MMDIEKLAREAGISILPGFDLEEDETAFPGGIDVTEMHKVKHFAALVLEEAAKVVDGMGAWTGGHGEPPSPKPWDCAEALRTLSRQLTTPPQEHNNG